MSSGINKSLSICNFTPKPLQSGHAPYGALKLNILGSNSDKEKLQCGHAKCSENNNSSALSPDFL